MKTRNGFVSNSSTTSFLIVGYKSEEKEIDLFKRFFPKEYEEIMNGSYEYPNDEIGERINRDPDRKPQIIVDPCCGDVFYGKIISKVSSSDNACEDVDISMEEVNKYVAEIQAASKDVESPRLMVITIGS